MSVLLSVCSLILSVVAICRTNNKALDIDYLGVIIGALGVIVTALIGWQIFSLVNVDTIYKRLQNAESEINKTSMKVFKELYKQSSISSMLHIWNLVQGLATADDTQIRLLYGLAADSMLNQLRADETNLIGQCLTTMEVCIQGVAMQNAWDRVFNETATKVMDRTYTAILPLSGIMTKTHSSRLTIIHYSRINKRLHESLSK